MYNKQILFICLGILLAGGQLLQAVGPGELKPQLFKAANDEFILYSARDNAPIIDVYTDIGGKIKRNETVKPKFPDKNPVVLKTTPRGDQYYSLKYTLIGKHGKTFYFINTTNRKIGIYNHGEGSFEEKIVLFPRIVKGVTPVGDSLLFSAFALMYGKVSSTCEDKYFVKKDHSMKDLLCFAPGKSMLVNRDFANTAVIEKSKKAVVYFGGASELSIYDTGTGELIDKYLVDRSQLEKFGKKAKREFLFESNGRLVLLKILTDKAVVFSLADKKWQEKKTVIGSFHSGILLDRYIVLLDKGGKIVSKALNN